MLLYQINTRILLTERAAELGRPATLDDVADPFLDSLAARGFRWVWFLGLWQTGEEGARISRTHPGIREENRKALPFLRDEDVCGSPFAVSAYTAHIDFGGDAALARLRERLAARNLLLVADFVVNHCAPDHPWLRSHPEFFIHGSDRDLAAAPGNWGRFPAGMNGDEAVIAHGRDPYFPGWADTAQLNLRHPACRDAVMRELSGLAGKCDGLRCDMAMLAQGDIFLSTWGARSDPADGALPAGSPFWPEAIGRVRASHPGFVFIAEVYWGREAELQAEGFDFTYDKHLYDRLGGGAGRPVREHLSAPVAFQEKSLRFLENHDEARAAEAFPPLMHRAAALIAFLVPGLRLFHEGQFEGRRARASVHLNRRNAEDPQSDWQAFYATLLGILGRMEIRGGAWRLEEIRPAWEANATWEQFVAFTWSRAGKRLMAVVNYGPERAQCYASAAANPEGLKGAEGGKVTGTIRFRDLLSDADYLREEGELAARGMYFDLPAWGLHLFEVMPG